VESVGAGRGAAAIDVQGASVEEALREHDVRRDARARTRSASALRNAGSLAVLGGSFLIAAAALPLLDRPRSIDWLVLCLGTLLYAIAFRIEFDLGPGSAVPTELVLVPLLLLLPPQVVPAATLVGVLVGGLGGDVRMSRFRRLLLHCSSLLHVLGPVAVLLIADVGPPALRHWPVYLAALGAQFALDSVAALGRNVVGLGMPARPLVSGLRWTFAVDALLAPIALAGVLATEGSATLGMLFALAPLGIVVLLHRDRSRQLRRSGELADLYRTAADRARLDALTGLRNRLAWDEAVQRVDADNLESAVLLLDLDGLKRANDTHGHRFGDRVIIEMARLLERNAPGAAVVARIGGDEFAALFVASSADRCASAEADVRAAITEHPGIGSFRLSAAIGSAARPPAATLAVALEEADARVYAEKRGTPGSRLQPTG
jgi:diguanylate cyclase (GGDEF)-like protein